LRESALISVPQQVRTKDLRLKVGRSAEQQHERERALRWDEPVADDPKLRSA